MRIFDVLLDLLQMLVFFSPIMHYNSIILFILSAIDVTRYFWPSWTILICLFRFSIWFVNLQIFRWSDRFSKRITFVISYSIVMCLFKRFSTKIRFVISLSFMDCIDVFLQRSWCSERVAANITLVISLSFM